MLELLSYNAMLFALLSMLCTSIQQTYIDPTIVPHYKSEFGVDDEELGTLLLFLGLGTVAGALLAMAMQSCMPHHYPLLLGNFVLGVAVYLVAPATHKGSLESSVAALYVTGVSHNLISVPMMTVIFDALKRDYEGHDQAIKDYIAVFVYFANSSGQFIGPIVGSTLT